MKRLFLILITLSLVLSCSKGSDYTVDEILIDKDNEQEFIVNGVTQDNGNGYYIELIETSTKFRLSIASTTPFQYISMYGQDKETSDIEVEWKVPNESAVFTGSLLDEYKVIVIRND